MREDFFIRYKAVVAYQGTDFSGWQSQPSLNTVQDYLESVLYKIFKRKQKIISSSRTDAGVHAGGQVFVFSAPAVIDKNKLLLLLNSNLCDSVYIKTLEKAEDSFHPRYSAKKKVYQYAFSFKKLSPFFSPYVVTLKDEFDLSIFFALLKEFEGTHNFRYFSYLERDDVNTVRTIYEVGVDFRADITFVTIIGSGFLRYMVRKIIGFLFLASYKEYSHLLIRDLLSGRDCSCSIPIAPAKGLLLKQVLYEDEDKGIKSESDFF